MRQFSRLDDGLTAAVKIGFAGIELNHQVTGAMLEGIDLHGFPIKSVHEPCPADYSSEMTLRQDWLISSTDEERRHRAVLAAKRSIDLAHSLGAKTVVVHPGSVPVDATLERNLRALYKAGDNGSDEYQEITYRLERAREKEAPARLSAAAHSLRELLAYAQVQGVGLGLENRFHYPDIPTPDELGELLSLGSAECLGFVYDCGHGQALEALGFFPHLLWLGRFASRLVGVHLHDITGLTDHQVPGQGKIDFKELEPYLPATAFRTLELRPDYSPAQVRAGAELLVEKGCVRWL